MLFASLVIERIPLHWGNLGDGIAVWLQNAGFVSMLGIAIVLLARTLQPDRRELNFWNFPEHLRILLTILKASVITAGIGFLFLLLVWLGERMSIPGLKRLLPREVAAQAYTIGDWILTISGALALFVAMAPLLVDLATRISVGRIWAIARLSWKEAIRGRVIWVFGAMALVFLFADWFVPHKPEDQLRSYVRVVYWSMTPLFLITAGLLGSFSIPTDVRNNSIHTIVTKPVEKFEIVLGRFFGFAALLTIGLFIVSGLSLIYVIRGVNDEATLESYTARVPLYGHLHFAGTKDSTRGESVGREWGYRTYITGQPKFKREGMRQYAIWDFYEIPADVRNRESDMIFEFSFDIFRLSKGHEGKGVACSFTFVDVTKFATADSNRQSQELDTKSDVLRKERDKRVSEKAKQLEKAGKGQGANEAENKRIGEELEREVDLELAKEYGIYQVAGQDVTDFHTQRFSIPAPHLRALLAEAHERKKGDEPQPVLRVFVSVDVADQAQMVGVAPQDFYLLAHEKPFWQNFLKGVIGMWCTHMLVLGVAVACSTYLSSVISLLITMFLFLAGMSVEYLREIAERRVDGGGPLQATVRLANKMSPGAQLEATPTTSIINAFDGFFSWWIGRIMNLIPDINRYDLHQYVANGFDIGWGDVLFLDNVLPLLAYLIPWAVLAYYQMKFREIANPR